MLITLSNFIDISTTGNAKSMILGICVLDQEEILLNRQKIQKDLTILQKLNSYTVDIFINGPLIFLSTVVDISSNGDEPLLNLTTSDNVDIFVDASRPVYCWDNILILIRPQV